MDQGMAPRSRSQVDVGWVDGFRPHPYGLVMNCDDPEPERCSWERGARASSPLPAASFRRVRRSFHGHRSVCHATLPTGWKPALPKGHPIGVAEDPLQPKLPAELKGKLPTARQLADAMKGEMGRMKDEG